jgi:hypothetical protein
MPKSKVRRRPGKRSAQVKHNQITADYSGYSSIVLQNRSSEMTRIIVAHGHDTATKSQAAAHEAGHCVVAAATGHTVTSASVFPNRVFSERMGRVIWEGRNHTEHPLYPRGLRVNPAKDHDPAMLVGIVCMAGFLGEVAVGLDHPSSSLDERTTASQICSALAQAWGMTVDAVARIIDRTCREAIEDNRGQFDAIRAHLETHDKLDAADAVRLLAGIKLHPVADIEFRKSFGRRYA